MHLKRMYTTPGSTLLEGPVGDAGPSISSDKFRGGRARYSSSRTSLAQWTQKQGHVYVMSISLDQYIRLRQINARRAPWSPFGFSAARLGSNALKVIYFIVLPFILDASNSC